jgi:hypothetical protein
MLFCTAVKYKQQGKDSRYDEGSGKNVPHKMVHNRIVLAKINVARSIFLSAGSLFFSGHCKLVFCRRCGI